MHRRTADDVPDYEDFLHRFMACRDRLFAFIFAMVPHEADAEDIFQQCSLILWRKYGDFRPEQSFFTWACGVAKFEVCNYLRKAGRSPLHFDDALLDRIAEQRLQSLSRYDDRMTALRSCLDSLTAEQHQLIDAAYSSDGRVTRLAEATGFAVQTLYNRLGRLRAQLLDCVRGKLEPLI